MSCCQPHFERAPFTSLALGLLALLAGLSMPAAARATAPEVRAARLYERAALLLDSPDIARRRQARGWLEEATLLAPDDPRYQIALGRAYYGAGFIKSARQRFERAAELAPRDAEARVGLGRIFRRDWLKYLERGSLEHAIEHFSQAARLAPEVSETWLELVPLHVAQGDLAAARASAAHAREADPDNAEADLAVAYVAYRLGEIDAAEEMFARTIPRLHDAARARFDDIGPVATHEDTVALGRLGPASRREFIRRFWSEYDPDPTTPGNEARLEYWSRVTQAYFLFFDARLGEWDQRGEVYVRYGPPETADYNPLGANLYVTFGPVGRYPANLLVWSYPSLGMVVTMQDRLLSERYMLPLARYHDPDPRPRPSMVGEQTGTLGTRDGRAVFPLLPPGTRPIPLEGVVARFEGEDGPRLLGQVESPGTPEAFLVAHWVVIDSTQREVARASRPLAASACEPTEFKVADFMTALAPGRYLAALSVRDGGSGRGVKRLAVEVPAPPSAVRLSDILIACGTPVVGGPVVRPEPNPAARVAGDEPLTAYFEIYGLEPGDDGRSRFEYYYTVRSAARDERIWIQRLFDPRPQPPPISATRAEEHRGSLRRQYVSVPVDDLPPGVFELEIRVRDLESGGLTASTARFERSESR